MSSLIDNKDDDKDNVKIENVYSIGGINDKEPSSKQKFFSEFIGTLLLVFVDCGVAVYSDFDIVASTLGGSLIIMSDVYMFQKISGAHFNLAVSLPMYIIKKITFRELIYYCIAQFTGGLFGCLLVALCRRGKFDLLASTKIGNYLIDLTEDKEIDAWCYLSALFCETFITFILVLVVLGSTIDKNKYKNLTGFVVGITITALIFTGFNISGSSMNPARSFAPAFFEAIIGGNTTAIKQIWIYIVGPIVGCVMATLIFFQIYN